MLIRKDALMEVHINCGKKIPFNNYTINGIDVIIRHNTNGRIQRRNFRIINDDFQAAIKEACITYGIILKIPLIVQLYNHWLNGTGYYVPEWYKEKCCDAIDLSFDDLANDFDKLIDDKVAAFNMRFAR